MAGLSRRLVNFHLEISQDEERKNSGCFEALASCEAGAGESGKDEGRGGALTGRKLAELEENLLTLTAEKKS